MMLMPNAMVQGLDEKKEEAALFRAPLVSHQSSDLDRAWERLRARQEQDVTSKFLGSQLYAAQTPRKKDRAEDELDAVTREAMTPAERGKKATDPQEKVSPPAVVPGNAASTNQIFRRAHRVWGGEDRMMKMLSGIAYTDQDARRDGVNTSPYVSSLQDYEAVMASPANKSSGGDRANTKATAKASSKTRK
jgi:hypothetical protein